MPTCSRACGLLIVRLLLEKAKGGRVDLAGKKICRQFPLLYIYIYIDRYIIREREKEGERRDDGLIDIGSKKEFEKRTTRSIGLK